MTDRTIYFHARCNDGLLAAYIYNLGRASKCIPVVHDKEYSLVESGSVVFVDMAPTKSQLNSLLENKEITSVLIVDHHATNDFITKITHPKLTVNYNVNEACAALMAANSLDPTNHMYERIKMFAEYADDRDRWKWARYRSREVTTYTFSVLKMPDHFQDPTEHFQLYDNLITSGISVDEMGDLGKKILETNDIIIQFLASQASRYGMRVGGKVYRIAMINTRAFRSEVCVELLKRHEIDFAFAWHYDSMGKFWLSMRSCEGRADVSEIAKELGGGGNHDAAGCTVDDLSKMLI